MISSQPLDIKLDYLANLVKEAGQLALSYFGKVKAQFKADRSLVSEADRAVEVFLSERLLQAFPGTAILGEEYGYNQNSSEHLWVLDPIDGTSAFLSNLPIWGVSIGYMYKQKALAGAFYLPVTDDLFIGNHHTALWNDRLLPESKPYKVDKETTLIIPSNAHRRYNIEFVGKTRNFGSAAAHVCYVAAGQAVGAVLGYVSVWDIAGALPILHKTGGDIYTLDGKALEISTLLKNYKNAQSIVVSPRWNIDHLAKQVSKKT